MYRITSLSVSSIASLLTGVILVMVLHTAPAQTPPTLPRLPEPPDVTERYIPNPKFYEVMMAFPHTNSYVRYNFQEVRTAARRDPELMVILGDHYRIGRSTQMDLRQALREYQRAAARGNAMAHHRIAYMYADGLGLPRDRDKILEHLKLGADGGDMLAQYDYALVYLNGKFQEARDLRKAYHYLQLASEQGHKLSTELLAMLAYHQGAPGAEIPYGFTTALELYRKAGDTDGERQLRENMGNWSGLRYYLRTLPGFLPGVDASLDPRKPEEGLALIKQLQAIQHITGEELFLQYADEITQNMLYHSYFEAQGDRIKLLGFLIFCYNNSEWTAPYQERYTLAAARDFRLTVNFSNTLVLEPYLSEFANYNNLFSIADLPIVADRVFVALLFRETDAEVQNATLDFLEKESWLIHNLTARYIVFYEDLLFEGYRGNLIEAPYQTADVIEKFFGRYKHYNTLERDTLTALIIPSLRLHAIHPHLSDKMITGIGALQNTSTTLTEIAVMLTASATLYRSDINNYFESLRSEPERLLGNHLPQGSIREIIDRVYTIIIRGGQQHLNTLCQQHTIQPERMLATLEGYRTRYNPELTLAENNDRQLLLEAGLLAKLIKIQHLNGLDPNNVRININTSLELSGRTSACQGVLEGYYLTIPYGTEPYSTMELTFKSRLRIDTEAVLYLLPPEHSVIRSGFFPDNESMLNRAVRISGVLPANQSVTFTIPMDKSIPHEKLVPVLRIADTQFAVFPIEDN